MPGAAPGVWGGAGAALHALVVCAAFADEVEARPLPSRSFAELVFDPGRPGSFFHFYDTMSQGQLRVRGTVLPRRYAAAGTAAEYVADDPANTGPYGRFVQEVLEAADRDVNFRLYDNDGPDGRPDSGDDDGTVDYVFVTVVSTPRSFIRRGATGIASLGFRGEVTTGDTGASGEPIRIGGTRERGCLVREGNAEQTVGSMAHEFGHALGRRDRPL
ncbi:MAG: immune inhibitor A domain-containing protein [Candidatus Latescibacterota bacterium]